MSTCRTRQSTRALPHPDTPPPSRCRCSVQDHIPPAGHVHDVYSLVVHALQLSDLMATGSTFRTLQMIKRHPGLLSLTPQQVRLYAQQRARGREAARAVGGGLQACVCSQWGVCIVMCLLRLPAGPVAQLRSFLTGGLYRRC